MPYFCCNAAHLPHSAQVSTFHIFFSGSTLQQLLRPNLTQRLFIPTDRCITLSTTTSEPLQIVLLIDSYTHPRWVRSIIEEIAGSAFGKREEAVERILAGRDPKDVGRPIVNSANGHTVTDFVLEQRRPFA